jgi:hypothetical protein
MTQYLSGGPMIFRPTAPKKKRKEIEERGGPAAPIPDKDKCVSGRHNKRINNCLCELFLKE